MAEKYVDTTEDNNNNSDDNSDDNNNNNEPLQAVITHQRLDSNAGHLANDASTTSSPVTENRTSTENKENKVKLSMTVQPNRKGNNGSRNADVKFNKLTHINTHTCKSRLFLPITIRSVAF